MIFLAIHCVSKSFTYANQLSLRAFSTESWLTKGTLPVNLKAVLVGLPLGFSGERF